MRAEDILRTLKGLFKSMDDDRAAVRAELRARGIPYAEAKRDAKGFCLTCGKGFLCPGVHTFEEIQEAARAEKEKAV
jgi:hypothetical protein